MENKSGNMGAPVPQEARRDGQSNGAPVLQESRNSQQDGDAPVLRKLQNEGQGKGAPMPQKSQSNEQEKSAPVPQKPQSNEQEKSVPVPQKPQNDRQDAPQRICKKCLLREMQEGEYFKNMYEYIAQLDPEIKAEDALYEERLTACKACEQLMNGMCRVCGCFVEMRAAVRKNYCPGVEKRW